MTLTTTATAKDRATVTGGRTMTMKEQQQHREGRHDQNKDGGGNGGGGGDESRTTTADKEGVKDRDSTVRRGRQAQGGHSAFFSSLAIIYPNLTPAVSQPFLDEAFSIRCLDHLASSTSLGPTIRREAPNSANRTAIPP